MQNIITNFKLVLKKKFVVYKYKDIDLRLAYFNGFKVI